MPAKSTLETLREAEGREREALMELFLVDTQTALRRQEAVMTSLLDLIYELNTFKEANKR